MRFVGGYETDGWDFGPRPQNLPPGTPWPPINAFTSTQMVSDPANSRNVGARYSGQQVQPQEVQYFRSCNAPAPPAAAPPTREVRVIYYNPADPYALPPAPPRGPPAPETLPSPRPSYIDMPSAGANQFRPGDTYKVVAVEENQYQAPAPPRVTYEYRGGGYGYPPAGQGGPRAPGGVHYVMHDPGYPY